MLVRGLCLCGPRPDSPVVRALWSSNGELMENLPAYGPDEGLTTVVCEHSIRTNEPSDHGSSHEVGVGLAMTPSRRLRRQKLHG